ncbi:MAG: acyl-homoserine-lactone acylase [Saprospiraceae bacterium]|jgi:acyl-homoserine-lactone acylase
MQYFKGLSITFLLFGLWSCGDQTIFVDQDQITIYRDQWGVPHIHAPTDEEVAYGLGWAQCEDDFVTLQEQMLAIQGRLGELKGKEGITIDFGIKFMGLREKVKASYSEINPKVQKILEQFALATNTYAKRFPEKTLLNGEFKVTPQDLVAGGLLGLVEITGAGSDLQKIMNNKIALDEADNFPKGSNAFAISSNRTPSGETFLAINSHQPMEGWYSWYEAHLISDEGQNILGGTFPGGTNIFHGTNKHLGWAHTVNHADFSDVYKLTMHPEEPFSYLVDGTYKKLTEKKYKSWLKIFGPIKIPISRTVYESDFGITFDTEDGFYAWRYIAQDAIKSIEQWYKMNRANNLEQFKSALNLQGIPCTNIVYADDEDNIFYISNGKLPKRESQYNWREVLPGDNSELQWDEGYWPLDSLPQVLNPSSGYVFNTNNTPFLSSDSLNNPQYLNRHKTMGYFTPEHNNNRSMRLSELLSQDTSISYEEFKAIKYDRQYPESLIQPQMINQELFLQLESSKYPDISDAIDLLKNWDRRMDVNNTEAMLVIRTADILGQILKEEGKFERGNHITEMQCVAAITRAKDFMLDKFSSLEIPLSEVQRHRRGEVDLPIAGGPDVIAAIYSKATDDNKYKAYVGESYIQLVRFTKGELPKLETVNAYGTSAVPGHEHSTDQMQMFVDQKLKPMTLSLEEVRANALRQYHPLRVEN